MSQGWSGQIRKSNQCVTLETGRKNASLSFG
jgi:hypothetical protein